ncbi:MAG: bifunctional phosphoglucose/phosphomannose isomerase [Candidatus Marinimicrobia bacterium]|jgi:glucose/mannose-6-phosphate isomerase|nr:bifunctional phosphoglucose/phosphomannose isomerase [Candidatus Neomarinimicrobiota bacterium]MDP6852909.1 bifunctional phosphoglucose/phosphomannose isomerase [Candidatus Neomarinimicrobiota bacterium]MDP6935978.1 bifunctional phosphoglucose/phosphomannose isomerase [Candidatus Neomarinimicrobiota bacterium]
MVTELPIELDQENMKGAIQSFPSHLRETQTIMESWQPMHSYSDIRQVMVLGMGGSAIGGDVVRVLVQNECKIPIMVNRSYNIPAWVDRHTLVIASSYSGGTEETLSAFSQCEERNCPTLIISTGGELTEIARKKNYDVVSLPKGLQPRAALGYSFYSLLLVLQKTGHISDAIPTMVENSIPEIESMSKELTQSQNEALTMAGKIHHTIPFVYGSEDLTWVAALRFRGQLAENAKMLSTHHHFPEQNHNEIEGWTCNPHILEHSSVVWLRDEEDHPGIQKRMDISEELLSKATTIQLSISQSGNNRVERLLSLIHFTDWVSYYCALLNHIDPTPVDRIQDLKARIA